MGQTKHIKSELRYRVYGLFFRALSCIFIGSAMMSSVAYAQQNLPATTRVLTPLTVTNETDMNFGRIIPGTTRSTIRIFRGNDTAVVRSGNATLVGGTVRRAELTITADPLASVQITLPRNIDIQNSAGDTMQINAFRLNNGGGRVSRRNVDSSGNLTIFVSGLLSVEPSQAVGIYNGNYEVIVEYN